MESSGSSSASASPQADDSALPRPPSLSSVGREMSLKDREHFGDVESGADDSGDAGAIAADKQRQQRKVRRRRGSRSSRTNSVSDQSSSCQHLPSSPSPQQGDEYEARSGHTLSSEEAEDPEEDAPEAVPEEDETTSTSSTDGREAQAILPGHRRPRRPQMRRRVRQPDELERALREKVAEIDRALSEAEGVERLRALAASEDGLMDDELRRRAWPRLANVPRLVTSEVLPSQEECERHPEYRQVVMDVDRSLKRFPPGIREEERPGLQDQLTRLIVRVLIKHGDKTLHYYQGYHDVAITFLLVVGEDMGYHILQRLTLTHLKEFMAPTMERTTYLLNYVYPILERESPALYDFLEASEVGTIFALPWLITWFGHVLPDYEDVVRLYDFFLARPPLMPVYLAAALVLHREQEVLLCECDMAMVHGLLSRIPSDLPFEKLLVDAQELYDSYPPKTLEKEVEDRFERLKEEYKLRGKTAKDVNAGGVSLYAAAPVVVGAVALGTPVLIGMAVWKWYNS